jgi:hypothetical protein
VWDSAQEWQRQPQTLRRALTETKVDASSDRRALLVGVEAYTQAGGQIERDLFQPQHEGYLTDTALLDRLVAEKLEALANEVRGEGWKWVEILPFANYSDLSKFGRIYPVHMPVSPEIRSEIEALQAEQEQISQAHQDAEEYPPDVDERMDEIEERIEELNDQTRQYREEEKKLAGAVVSIESIHRGLVRSEEKGGCPLDSHAKGIETSFAQVRLSEIQDQWLKRIPEEPEELWDWLLDQEQSVVMELLAFCVGQTVHAVRLAHDSGSAPRFLAADRLAKALNLDMADWWTPTGENYLGRVKKDQILEAISEGTGETNLEELRKLKKGELAAAAEARLSGTRWLPKILKS